MWISGLKRLWLRGWVIAILFLLPMRVYAQDIISGDRLDEWFYSRLGWAFVLGLIISALIGIYLSRLKISLGEYQANTKARNKFWLLLFLFLGIGAVLIFLDAFLIYDFGSGDSISLTFPEAFGQVWLSYRTIPILLTAALAFYLGAALTTRFLPNSRWPYILLPGPKGK